jgi:hypothetical protein
MNEETRHPGEADWVAFAFDDHDDPASLDRHLEICARCRAELAAIQRTLGLASGAAVPERGEHYADDVWRRLKPRLKRRRMVWWPSWQGMAAAAALASLVVAAFMLGRQSSVSAPPVRAGVEKRLLNVTLAEHLEQSQRLLTEVENSSETEFAGERGPAADLVAANRLYRQTAYRTGDTATAALLDELERYLLEARHADGEEWRELRRRLDEDGLLFRLRVLNQRMRTHPPLARN